MLHLGQRYAVPLLPFDCDENGLFIELTELRLILKTRKTKTAPIMQRKSCIIRAGFVIRGTTLLKSRNMNHKTWNTPRHSLTQDSSSAFICGFIRINPRFRRHQLSHGYGGYRTRTIASAIIRVCSAKICVFNAQAIRQAYARQSSPNPSFPRQSAFYQRLSASQRELDMDVVVFNLLYILAPSIKSVNFFLVFPPPAHNEKQLTF